MGDLDCDCGDSRCAFALALYVAAEAKLPESVCLFYLSQGDKLSDEQIKEIFVGDLEKVEEHIYDWYRDNDEWSVDYVVGEVVSRDEKECLDNHGLLSELQDAIRERDEGDPVGELMRATPDVYLRIGTGVEIDEDDEDLAAVCNRLGISQHDNRTALEGLIAEHEWARGEVEILWRASIHETCKELLWKHDPEDDTELCLVFHDPFISVNGWTAEIFGRVVVPYTGEIPTLESDFWSEHPNDLKQIPTIVTRFDEYRNGIVKFFDYRAMLLERKASAAVPC